MQQTATPKKAPKKFFYGWIIVLCCTLLMAVGTGIFVNCVGIFVKPVCEDLGFERGTFTLYTTITSVLSMLAMLVFGELYRKKPRRIRLYIAIGGLTGCLVFFGCQPFTAAWPPRWPASR